jgi:hypothetical protein
VAEDTFIETRYLWPCLLEHRHNLHQRFLGTSKITQYDYENSHRVGWHEDKILERENNSRYRKYKESALMAYLTNPISQPILGNRYNFRTVFKIKETLGI